MPKYILKIGNWLKIVSLLQRYCHTMFSSINLSSFSHVPLINQVPLPSGTSIGTKKRRATEKKNATIRQHYYPEVEFDEVLGIYHISTFGVAGIGLAKVNVI